MNKRTKEENNPDLTPPNVEKWLLSCDQCQKKAHLMADAKYAWAVIASCKKCGSWWTYCRVCSKQKIKYEKSAQRSNHHNQKHSGQVLPASRIPEEQHFTPQKKKRRRKKKAPYIALEDGNQGTSSGDDNNRPIEHVARAAATVASPDGTTGHEFALEADNDTLGSFSAGETLASPGYVGTNNDFKVPNQPGFLGPISFMDQHGTDNQDTSFQGTSLGRDSAKTTTSLQGSALKPQCTENQSTIFQGSFLESSVAQTNFQGPFLGQQFTQEQAGNYLGSFLEHKRKKKRLQGSFLGQEHKQNQDSIFQESFLEPEESDTRFQGSFLGPESAGNRETTFLGSGFMVDDDARKRKCCTEGTSPKRSNYLVYPTTCSAEAVIGPPDFSSFNEARNRDFFINDQEPNGGLKYLMALCYYNNPSMAEVINHDDMVYHCTITKFLSSCTRQQGEMMANIIRQTQDKAKRHVEKGVKLVNQIPFPDNKEDVRKFFFDGKFAFFPNLPHPPVIMLEDENHAYISLKYCIQDLLAFGVDVENFNKTDESSDESKKTKLAHSDYARDMMGRVKADYNVPVIPLLITEWSDDYDPNGSNKNNRGSVWIKQVTISIPHETRNDIVNTYPIAMGEKGEDHTLVEEKFAIELLELSSADHSPLIYSKANGGMVRVHVEMCASLMDQPERRSANFLMAGNGVYAARWGYAMNLLAISKVLPACDTCFKKMKKGDRNWNKKSCRKCCQWDVESKSSALQYNPPQDFPPSELDKTKKLRPTKLTFGLLQKVCEKAEENYVKETWTEDNVKAYMSAFALNEVCADKLLEQAKSRKYALLFETLPGLSTEDKEEIRKEYRDNPGKCSKFIVPPMWTRGVQFDQHLDVIMHLLFLGVVDKTMDLVTDWCKSRRDGASFSRMVIGRLESVQGLRLDWCKIQPYGGGRGGWVSENYLGFARLMNWFYLELENIGEFVPYSEPDDKPQDKWTKPENTAWLKARQLSTEGLAQEVSWVDLFLFFYKY